MSNNEQLKRAIKTQKLQIKALLVPNPKQLDQSVFLGQNESLIHAFINSFGEAWLSPAPIHDCLCDDDAWTTSTNYPAGKKVGSGYDPRGWQQSLIVREQEELNFEPLSELELNFQKLAAESMPVSLFKIIYDNTIGMYITVRK